MYKVVLALLLALLPSMALAQESFYVDMVYMQTGGGTFTGAVVMGGGGTFTTSFGPSAFGSKYYLDQDGDTNISCGSDDTCELEVNGADRVEFTSTTTTFRNVADNANLVILADSQITAAVALAAQAGLANTDEADLAVGSCTANRIRRDTGGANREFCWCNAGGTAYDCVTITTANGPTN